MKTDELQELQRLLMVALEEMVDSQIRVRRCEADGVVYGLEHDMETLLSLGLIGPRHFEKFDTLKAKLKETN